MTGISVPLALTKTAGVTTPEAFVVPVMVSTVTAPETKPARFGLLTVNVIVWPFSVPPPVNEGPLMIVLSVEVEYETIEVGEAVTVIASVVDDVMLISTDPWPYVVDVAVTRTVPVVVFAPVSVTVAVPSAAVVTDVAPRVAEVLLRSNETEVFATGAGGVLPSSTVIVSVVEPVVLMLKEPGSTVTFPPVVPPPPPLILIVSVSLTLPTVPVTTTLVLILPAVNCTVAWPVASVTAEPEASLPANPLSRLKTTVAF